MASDGGDSGLGLIESEEMMASWLESTYELALLQRILTRDSCDWLIWPSLDILEDRRTSMLEPPIPETEISLRLILHALLPTRNLPYRISRTY